MLGENLPTKYDDLGNLTVNIHIGKMYISNTLVDLGVAINLMRKETFESLEFTNLIPTPTILEIADRSKIQLEGILEDVVISVDS